MKRFLIAILLLLPFSAWAGQGMFPIPMVYQGGSAPSGDTCATGSLLTSWHMEDLDLANDDGCSVLGDTVWGETEAAVDLSSTDKSEGTYSGYGATALDAHILNPTQNVSADEGTVWLDIRLVTFQKTQFFNLIYDNSNRIYFQIEGTAGAFDIWAVNQGNGTAKIASANTNFDETSNGWYRIKYQWKVAASAADHQLDIWALDSSTPRQTTGSPTTVGPKDDLTQMTSTPDTIKIGVISGLNAEMYWDNFKYYATSDL